MDKTISNIGRERACGFRDLRGIMAVEDKFDDTVVNEKSVDIVSSEDSLFSSIFTINPITKLPDGDLAMYMNQNTSPEVRLFIEQTLMKDMGESGTVDTSQLSDDDIVRYSRHHGESDADYRQRIYDTLVNEMKSASVKHDGE